MTISLSTQKAIVYSLLVSLAAGLVVALGPYYDSVSTDAIVVYLAGSMKWTPFYWALDRFGMIIPALTVSIRDPLTNMIVQNVLYVMTTILAFLLLAKYLFSHLDWKKIGLWSAIAFVALSSAGDLKPFFTPYQNYTPAMVFGLLALIFARKRPLLSFALAALAQYGNFAMIILLVFLSFAKLGERAGRLGFRRVFPEARNASVILALSAAFAYFLRLPYMKHAGQYGTLPWSEAITGWIGLLRDYYETGSNLWLLIFPVMAAAYVTLPSLLFRDSYARHTHRAFWVAQFALFGWAFVVGGNVFAKWNGYPKRYLIPALMLWMVCWTALAVRHWPRQWSVRKFEFLQPAILILVLMLRLGVPTPGAVSDSLEARFGKTYRQVSAACTHVVGDYYRTWDASFYSMIKKERPLWAITYRAQVIREHWDPKTFSDPRICYWQNNEEEASEVLASFGIRNFTKKDFIDGLVMLTAPSDLASTDMN